MILASAPLASVVLSAAAAAAYAVPAAAATRLSAQTSRIALWVAWLLHAVALAAALLAEPARFGFAPALSVTAWLVLTVYAVESHVFPQLRARWALAGLGRRRGAAGTAVPGQSAASLGLALAAAALGAGHRLLWPVRRGRVHAWLMTRAEKQMRQAASEVHAGVPLLTLSG